jgi:hypothetical protein
LPLVLLEPFLFCLLICLLSFFCVLFLSRVFVWHVVCSDCPQDNDIDPGRKEDVDPNGNNASQVSMKIQARERERTRTAVSQNPPNRPRKKMSLYWMRGEDNRGVLVYWMRGEDKICEDKHFYLFLSFYLFTQFEIDHCKESNTRQHKIRAPYGTLSHKIQHKKTHDNTRRQDTTKPTERQNLIAKNRMSVVVCFLVLYLVLSCVLCLVSCLVLCLVLVLSFCLLLSSLVFRLVLS